MLIAKGQARRHDGIEHDRPDRRGVATQVFEPYARAVRNSDQVELRDSQRTAHVLEVGNVRAGRIGANVDVRPEFLQAVGRQSARLVDTRGIEKSQRLIVQRPGTFQWIRSAGAALVHEQHVTLAQNFAKRGVDGWKGFEGRLAGAAGQHDDRVPGRGLRRARHPGDREIELAAVRAGAIFCNPQRCAARGYGLRLPGLRQRAGRKHQAPVRDGDRCRRRVRPGSHSPCQGHEGPEDTTNGLQ